MEFEASLKPEIGVRGAERLGSDELAVLDDRPEFFDEETWVACEEDQRVDVDGATAYGVAEFDLPASLGERDGAAAGAALSDEIELEIMSGVVDSAGAFPGAVEVFRLGGSGGGEGLQRAVVGLGETGEDAGFVLLKGNVSSLGEDALRVLGDAEIGEIAGGAFAGFSGEEFDENAGAQVRAERGGVGIVGVEEFNFRVGFADRSPGETGGGDLGIDVPGGFGIGVVEAGLEFGEGFAGPGEIEDRLGVFALDFGIPEARPTEEAGGFVDGPFGIGVIVAQGGLVLQDDIIPSAIAEDFESIGEAPEVGEGCATTGDAFGFDAAAGR